MEVSEIRRQMEEEKRTPSALRSAARRSSSMPRSISLREKFQPVSFPTIEKTGLLSERRKLKLEVNTSNSTKLTRNAVKPIQSATMRKSYHEVLADEELLLSRGLKSTVPDATNLFRDNLSSKLNTGLSVTDLWGPKYTRKQLKAVGLYDAFRAIEKKNQRRCVALEGSQTTRYVARHMDDISLMRVFNQERLQNTTQSPGLSPGFSPPESKSPPRKKVLALESILERCSTLSKDNQEYRKSLSPLTATVKLRSRKTKKTV